MFALHYENNTENPLIGSVTITHSERPKFVHYIDRINLSDVLAVDTEIANAKTKFDFLVSKEDAANQFLAEIKSKLDALFEGAESAEVVVP